LASTSPIIFIFFDFVLISVSFFSFLYKYSKKEGITFLFLFFFTAFCIYTLLPSSSFQFSHVFSPVYLLIKEKEKLSGCPIVFVSSNCTTMIEYIDYMHGNHCILYL